MSLKKADFSIAKRAFKRIMGKPLHNKDMQTETGGSTADIKKNGRKVKQIGLNYAIIFSMKII